MKDGSQYFITFVAISHSIAVSKAESLSACFENKWLLDNSQSYLALKVSECPYIVIPFEEIYLHTIIR